MSTPTALQLAQQLAQQAAAVQTVDMTETSTGGGGAKRILETGSYMARLCEYIEKGVQKNAFEPAKAPRAEAELRFAVFPIDEVEGVRTVSKTPVFISTFNQGISNNEKATLKGAYQKMNYRNDSSKTHLAMFLGEAFMIGVVKYKTKAGKDANKLDLKLIAPALNPISGTAYPVPVLEDSAYRVFFWDMPTKETWDALYIEGSFEDGDRKGESKNFIQNEILKAVNFPGSALEQLLGGASIPTDMYSGTDVEADVPASVTAPPTATLPDAAPWEAPAEETLAEALVAPAAPAMPEAPAFVLPEA